MITTHRIRAALLVTALAALSCNRTPHDAAAAAALGEGVAVFPAETRMVVGMSFPKIGGSDVGKRVLDWLLTADPQQNEVLTRLLAQCHIDPTKDLDSALVGMGDGPSQVAVLVRGKLTQVNLLACVRQAMTEKGGTLDETRIEGRAVWCARDPKAGTSTWMTIDDGRGVLVASSEEWLKKALDPKAAKLPSRPEVMALIKRVDPSGPLWLAGLMRPEMGERLPKLTRGAVKAPAVSFTFEMTFGGGVGVDWKIDMQTEADAGALAEFARSQQMWLSLAASKFGLGRIVNKMMFAPDGKTVKIAVQLDADEVGQLADGLAKLAE